jgi:hypothetical protein
VLCQRIRLLLPEINIVAGIWGFSGDLEKAKERFGNTPPDRVVTTLGQAVEQISQWNITAMNAGQMSIPEIDSPQIPAK